MSNFEWFLLSLFLVVFAIVTPVKVDNDETGIGRIFQLGILITGIIIGMLAVMSKWQLWQLSAGYGIIFIVIFRIFDVPRQFPKKLVK